MGVLTRLWIPLLTVVVLIVGGFTVLRLHGVFGSEVRPRYADTESEKRPEYNPKQLQLEVFGPPGTVASISYFDADAEPKFIEKASLPWSLQFPMSETTATINIIAQGNSDRIGCRITLDHEVKAERVSNGASAFTYCLLKAA